MPEGPRDDHDGTSARNIIRRRSSSGHGSRLLALPFSPKAILGFFSQEGFINRLDSPHLELFLSWQFLPFSIRYSRKEDPAQRVDYSPNLTASYERKCKGVQLNERPILRLLTLNRELLDSGNGESVQTDQPLALRFLVKRVLDSEAKRPTSSRHGRIRSTQRLRRPRPIHRVQAGCPKRLRARSRSLAHRRVSHAFYL